MSANPYNPISQIPNMGRQWSLVVTSPPDDTGNSTQATLA